MQYRGHQHDDAEQAEEAGGGPFNRFVRPLMLSLKAEMGPELSEGHLDTPAGDKPDKDLVR